MLLLVAGAVLAMHAGFGQAAGDHGSSPMSGSSVAAMPLTPNEASSGHDPALPEMAAMAHMCASTPAVAHAETGVDPLRTPTLPAYVVNLSGSTQMSRAAAGRPPPTPDPVTELGISRT